MAKGLPDVEQEIRVKATDLSGYTDSRDRAIEAAKANDELSRSIDVLVAKLPEVGKAGTDYTSVEEMNDALREGLDNVKELVVRVEDLKKSYKNLGVGDSTQVPVEMMGLGREANESVNEFTRNLQDARNAYARLVNIGRDQIATNKEVAATMYDIATAHVAAK